MTEKEILQLLVQSVQDVNTRLDNMQTRMDERFSAVDAKFDSMQKQMDERFDAVDKRLDKMQNDISEIKRDIKHIASRELQILDIALSNQ